MGRMHVRRMAIFLALALVMTSLLTASPVVRADSDEGNLLLNGGFEQDVDNWQAWGSGFQVVTDAVYTHSGNKAVEVANANGGGQFIHLKAATTYKLSGYGKTTGGTGGGITVWYTLPGDSDMQDRQIGLRFDGNDTNYTYKETTFTTSDDLVEEDYKSRIGIWNDGSPLLYLDDFSLVEVTSPAADSLITNASFESDLASWNKWAGTFAVTSDAVHSGNHALQIDQNSGGNQWLQLMPGKTYKLGVYGKTTGSGSTGSVVVKYMQPGDTEPTDKNVVIPFDLSNSSFTYKELTFTTPLDMVTGDYKTYVGIWNEGVTTLYLDDFSLREVGSSTGGSSGGSNGGSSSTRLPKLTSLQVGGSTVAGFDPNLNSYDVNLPYGTTVVPQVSASASTEQVVITQAEQVPGTAVVQVIENGQTNRYFVRFVWTASAALDENFNGAPMGTLPAGFEVRQNGAGTYQTVALDGDQVLKLKHTTDQSTNGVTHSFDPQTGSFTFEYRMKNTDQGTVPIIRLGNKAAGTTALSLVEGWGPKFNIIGQDFSSADKPENKIVDANLDLNAWRHYKLIVNVPKQTFDIYLDDVLRVQGAHFLANISSIDTLSIEHIAWAQSGETYVDDMKINQLRTTPSYAFNGDFSQGLTHWSLAGDQATLEDDHGRGKLSLPGNSGDVNVTLSKAYLAQGQSYALSFSVRGSFEQSVTVSVYSNGESDSQLLHSETIQAGTAPHLSTLYFQTNETDLNLQNVKLVFTFHQASAQAWTGYLDNIQLLPSDAVLPLLKSVEYFTIDTIQAADVVTAEGTPYAGVPVKRVTATFMNESLAGQHAQFFLAVVDASGAFVSSSAWESDVDANGETSLTASFLLPGDATGYRIQAYVRNPEQKQAYSPIAERALER
ncbi:hypothetical protein A8709_13590 [Paenibacillus pectinilyticus]|uniref:CBM-cenC domain-containing protein n=1 Tax=Paenibacillus pectinilyticus TaxID=512399 RepID=A0A1C1A3L6_9BACL|nr:carbohydrate binding domain-containing protein [Paenibacillus pectinilyticus]OCT15136.1 hypothetical protein A8709_13590 [Paenibacillus pectinilyticus]